MNILATSDLHGNIEVYRQLAHRSKQKDIDIVIIAGDLTSYSKYNQEDEIKSILKSINKPVLSIMGNDDEYEWSSEYNIININQNIIKIDEISFIGYHYSNPFVGGLFEKREIDQKKDFDELLNIITKDMVLITHGPCFGILDKAYDGTSVGSKALYDFCKISSPKYHLFGHIHESCGIVGNHFNVSYPIARSVIKINYYTNEYEVCKL